MLSEPQHGWTFVQIEDFKEPASYITDVPNKLIDGKMYNAVLYEIMRDDMGF